MSNDLRNLFKPEDFYGIDLEQYGRAISPEEACEMAQSILNEALDKAVRVYGHFDGKTFHVPDSKLGLKSGTANPDTHQALLVAIEELAKKECEHEGVEKSLGTVLTTYPSQHLTGFFCKHCGVKLVARWEKA